MLSLLGAILIFGLMVFLKVTGLRSFIATPLPLVVVMLTLVGFLSILLGLVAELTVRTYYESQGKRTYSVKSVEGGE